MSQPLSPAQSDGNPRGYQPAKLPAAAIFALLDRAPFGRLATYAPPDAGAAGCSYVVPLQFVYHNGALLIITRPGRKVDNLRRFPHGVCMQVDVTEGNGWTSVCAWGNYVELRNSGERISAVLASFGKYPNRTTSQASSWFRQHTPGYSRLRPDQAARGFVVGRIELTSVAGRYWSGLHVPGNSPILHGQGPASDERGVPLHLSGDDCRALLQSTPLARLSCFHPTRRRVYCLPFWYIFAGGDFWFYHPAPDGELIQALREHPDGVCLQADNLNNTPAADPGHPWRSVIAEGRAEVFSLGPTSTLPPAQQRRFLTAIANRVANFGIRTAFAPPPNDDPTTSAPGLLIHLRVERLAGQATA